jgi:hypothetical protein
VKIKKKLAKEGDAIHDEKYTILSSRKHDEVEVVRKEIM